MSGVPFGLPAQVLGDNREQWHALLFGMTCRIYPDPHRCNPRPLWAALDALGLRTPRLLGWWDAAAPVRVRGAPSVRATVYAVGGTVAVALANWAPRAVRCLLEWDWETVAALGLQRPAGASAQLSARAIQGFQPAGSWGPGEELELQPKGSGHNEGWLLTLGFAADGRAGNGFLARAWG